MTKKRGTLYLVVGPSGAGKDSLIDGAKAALQGNGSYIFPRRYITRPPDAGGEDHIPVSAPMFEVLRDRGDMMMHWHAHNLLYGVPRTVDDHLARGCNVVVNVSRTVADEARAKFAPVVIVYVSVSDEVLAQRLRARGRESKSDIAKRVARAREYMLNGDDVFMIDNSGTLEDGVSAFLKTIGQPRVA